MDKPKSTESKIAPWELLEEEDISPSKYFPLFKQKVKINDETIVDDYYITRLPDATMIVAITEDKELIMVKQWRQGVSEIALELPCGQNEKGETPVEVAKRELMEETGIISNNFLPLGVITMIPPKTSVRIYGYLCHSVKISKAQTLDMMENIEIVKIPVKEIDSLLKSGEINASDTISFITLAKLKFPNLFL